MTNANVHPESSPSPEKHQPYAYADQQHDDAFDDTLGEATQSLRTSVTSPFETLSERLLVPESQDVEFVEIGELYGYHAHSTITPTLFSDVRHGLKIPLEVSSSPTNIVSRWRQKDRLKTTAVALVVCLNIGVDPPDVIKISPCARMECWMDPLSMQAQKALDTIGKNLQAQYERWQPRAKYKIHLDPTSDEVKKLVSSCRRSAKNERVLFHYNGHGVPRPTSNGEIWYVASEVTQVEGRGRRRNAAPWCRSLSSSCSSCCYECLTSHSVRFLLSRVFNKSYTQYIPLSIYDLQSWMGTPAIYIFDCSIAGQILLSFKQFFAREMKQGSTILMCACGELELLPQDPAYPADLFTCCLTTPIKIALHVFCSNSMLAREGITKELIDRIPGKQNDRKTPLGELNWIFTAITDTIAWNALPRALFQKLFRQDLLVASLFRNFLLAQRVMRQVGGCTPVSHPRLPIMDQHPMWLAWDMAAETCLLQLPNILEGEKEYVPSLFFSEQLTAFELWLNHGGTCDDIDGVGEADGAAHEAENYTRKHPPEQLPIVLQVLLSQVHRLRALVLLGRFIDMGSWAVDLALSVGIFPYILKLLQTSAGDLRQTLVFIWAKIVSWDMNPQVQNDLTKDGGYLYFIRHLQEDGDRSGASVSPSMESKAQAAFILSAICRKNKKGQSLCVQAGLVEVIVELLGRERDEELLKWLLILCGEFDEIDHELVLEPFLDHDSPSVRAAAVYSSRGDGWRRKAADGSQLVRHEVAVKALAAGGGSGTSNGTGAVPGMSLASGSMAEAADAEGANSAGMTTNTTVTTAPSTTTKSHAHDESIERLLDDPCLDVRYLAMMCVGGSDGPGGSGRGKIMGPLPKSYQSKTWKKNDSFEYQSPVNFAGEQTMRWPLLGPLAEEEPGAPWLKRQVEERPKDPIQEISSVRCLHKYSINVNDAMNGSEAKAAAAGVESLSSATQLEGAENPHPGDDTTGSMAAYIISEMSTASTNFTASYSPASLVLEPWKNEVVVCGSSTVRMYGCDSGAIVKEFDTGFELDGMFRLNDNHNEVLLCCGAHGVAAYRGYAKVGEDITMAASFVPFDTRPGDGQSVSFAYSDQYLVGSFFAACDTELSLWNLHAERRIRKIAMPKPIQIIDTGKAANVLFTLDAYGGVGMLDLRAPTVNAAVLKAVSDGSYIAAGLGGCAVALKGGGMQYFETRQTSGPLWSVQGDQVQCLAGTRLANIVACGTSTEFAVLDTRNGERLWSAAEGASVARFVGCNGLKVGTAGASGRVSVYEFMNS